jgi:hypothetical protein
MSSIELQVKNKTANGSVHLQVKSSGDDLGLLYLTSDQYSDLVKIIRVGCFSKEVDLCIEDPYNDAQEEEDDNDSLPTFFAID